jgi:DNA-binding NtrC family response regulator
MTPMGLKDQSGIHVLIVDDEEHQRSGLQGIVSAWGYEAETAADGQEALEKLETFPAQVVISDLMMPRMDGATLLRELGERGSKIPVIVLTAFGNVETAVSTIQELGAFWFLEKPVQAKTLRVLLERATAQSQLAEQTERLRRQLSYQGVLGDLVGPSPVMQEVFSLISQVAPSRAAVLVTGESGTGKELVARAIHNLSPRSGRPFVAINCAALPESLMESELFGHEKGSFTGALERRPGCFELAQSGTLLLDEIGEMPFATQAKLLRVLEDSRVRRLGGRSEINVDVRIVAATNRDPLRAVQDGKLREDLYYRLNVFHIPLPPLRDRKQDIPALVEALAREVNRRNDCRVGELDDEVFAIFEKHDWPGNVRELRNVMERAIIVAGEGTLRADHLPPNFAASRGLMPPRQVERNAITVPIGATVGDAEQALILKTLEHTGNNKTRAAEILGISLKTLHNKLKEYGARSET